MNAPKAIELAPAARLPLAKAPARPVVKKPGQLRSLRLIAGRLRTLHRINQVELPARLISRDEVVRSWTVSYFLPMLKSKSALRQDKPHLCDETFDLDSLEGSSVRAVLKLKKGLKLPRIFAPCKKFENAR